MHIALLAAGNAWRGSGTSLVNVAHGLATHGHTVQLLTTTQAVTAHFTARGLQPQQLAPSDTGIGAARQLSRVLGALATDVLVVETAHDLRRAALASLVRRVAVVYRHSIGHASFPRDVGVRLACRRTAMTIFLTASAALEARRLAPFLLRPPSRVIHEGIDVELFRPDAEAGRRFRDRHALRDRSFLLAVGALEPEKRYDWLLEAVACLEPPVPPLLICGEGRAAPLIRAQAARLGLDVRLLGLLTPAGLVEAYNAASVLVHAGREETFGLAVAEAMACARPVVVVAGGALPEVVGEAGTVVASEDPGAFARGVAALLDDSSLRDALATAARTRAVTEFSLARMAREYAAALDTLD